MTELTLKERNLRFALLKALVDAATAELGKMRADHLGQLLEQYDENGTKSFSVRLPSTGALIGALTLPDYKDKFEVIDEQAFTEWFASAHPDGVDIEIIPGEPERTVVIPATEDQRVITIDPKHRTQIMKKLEQTEDGQVADPISGSVVAGVKFTAGKRPDKFSVTYETGGTEHLVNAYRAGELNDIVAGTSLPPVGDRVIVERHLSPVQVEVFEDRPILEMPSDPDGGVDLAMGSEDYPDSLGPEHSDGYQLPGEPDPWAKPSGADDEFDPGDWGAPSTSQSSGW